MRGDETTLRTDCTFREKSKINLRNQIYLFEHQNEMKTIYHQFEYILTISALHTFTDSSAPGLKIIHGAMPKYDDKLNLDYSDIPNN